MSNHIVKGVVYNVFSKPPATIEQSRAIAGLRRVFGTNRGMQDLIQGCRLYIAAFGYGCE